MPGQENVIFILTVHICLSKSAVCIPSKLQLKTSCYKFLNTLLVNSLCIELNMWILFFIPGVLGHMFVRPPYQTYCNSLLKCTFLTLSRLGRAETLIQEGFFAKKKDWDRETERYVERVQPIIANSTMIADGAFFLPLQGLGTSVPVPRMSCDCSLYRQPLRATDASLSASGLRCQFTARSRCSETMARHPTERHASWKPDSAAMIRCYYCKHILVSLKH